jgi:large subunit ribosomal protein MRP49
MTVERTTNQEGPALMTIYFNDTTQPQVPSASVASTQSDPAPSNQQHRLVTINMKHRHESEILSQLLALTNAVPVEPTPDEVEQLRELAEQQELSEKDSTKHRIYNEEKKREEAIISQARAASG